MYDLIYLLLKNYVDDKSLLNWFRVVISLFFIEKNNIAPAVSVSSFQYATNWIVFNLSRY